MSSQPMRLVNRLAMRPVFTSLGLSRDDFSASPGDTVSEAPFDAGVNCGPRFPGCIWLFRGGECFRYDLRHRAFVDGPTPLADWGGPAWPALFATGIDTAVWGGPQYPALHWFFKGSSVLRVASDSWTVHPFLPLLQAGFGSLQGTALTTGLDAAFHDVRPEMLGHIHLIRGGQYVRHNLNTGERVGELQALAEALPGLPEEFQQGFDVAFYGDGRDAETLYLFRESDCCTYSIKSGATVSTRPIEAVFPAMQPYVPRPQLFLVESFLLDTYTTEPTRGDVVATQTVPPNSSTKAVLVTERTQESNSKITQSLLQSQDEATSDNFYEAMSDASQIDRSSESYRYHLESQLHGEVGLKGVWGGEMDASLSVQGGSDDVRQRFATQTMRTLGSQVSRTNRQYAQRAVSSELEIKSLERVVSTQTFEQHNPTNSTLTIKYYQAIQPYRAVLILERIRLAYSDGRSLEVRELVDAERLLARAMESEEKRARVLQSLRRACSEVTDCLGNRVSLLSEDGERLELRRNPVTQIRFAGPGGGEQELSVPGIAVRSEEFLVRTPHLLGSDA